MKTCCFCFLETCSEKRGLQVELFAKLSATFSDHRLALRGMFGNPKYRLYKNPIAACLALRGVILNADDYISAEYTTHLALRGMLPLLMLSVCLMVCL